MSRIPIVVASSCSNSILFGVFYFRRVLVALVTGT